LVLGSFARQTLERLKLALQVAAFMRAQHATLIVGAYPQPQIL
jgi:hypothetical protein